MLAIQSMNKEISNFLQERIDAGDFPSAVYLVAEKGEIVFQDALAYAVVEPERIEARIDTIYDLASLTKPLVTGLLAAKLIETGEIVLDDPIVKLLNEFNSDEMSTVTVRDLAIHISRFPSWIPLYLISRSLLRVPEAIASQPLVDFTGSTVLYSDLNFIALAFVIERARFGRRIDLEAQEEIFEPLLLKRTIFNPGIEDWEQVRAEGGRRIIAGSEKGNEYEKQTCIEQGYLKPPATAGGTDWSASIPACTDAERSEKNPVATAPGSDLFFRNYHIWGEVHDGNAFFMGGVAGHAGLFSTAEEVFKIAQQFLPNYTRLLKPQTCELFRTNFTPGMNEGRSFAFQLASSKDSTAGTKMSPESFGHNGFTGTSLWIDPVRERIFILLTNRTHAHDLPFVNINSVRRRFHDLAIDILDKNI